MDNLQNDKFETCTRVNKYILAHATDLATIPDAALEITNFTNAFTNINKAVQLQTLPAGASADAAAAAKTAMANTVFKYISRASVKAKQLGNIELSALLDQSFTYIYQAPKALAVSRSNELKQLLSDNTATLTNITAAILTEIGAAINKYNDLKEVPIQEIQTKSADGTSVLPEELKKAFDAIENLYKLIFSYFNDVPAKKNIVTEFELAKQIIHTGVRYTGIAGDITVNGAALEGILVEIVGTKKKTTTDFYGHYSILKVKAGPYHIKATLPTGETQTLDIKIEKGHTMTLDFHF